MDLIDSKETKDIGWHLIARGGDMTARVHPSMSLGILPSGDLSFEPPDAVVALDLAGQALTLCIVAEEYEFETETGERTQTIRVSPQTHVCLDFLGHTLDIDNDFAVASRPGNALSLYTVRKGEKRRARGPVSARTHGPAGEIILPEQAGSGNLTRLPVDYLQREHAAAAADKRKSKGSGGSAWKAIGALAGSLLVIGLLATLATQVAEVVPAGDSVRQETAPGADKPAAVTTAAASADETLIEAPAAAPEALAAEPSPLVADPEAAGLNQDVLDRFSALLAVEPLPDKATLDFVIESLRSLMIAYPGDERVPQALASLNERLVEEARSAYDDGNGFRAGRLIEQAAALGMADASVQETLAYFEQQPPGRRAPVVSPDSAPAAAKADGVAETQPDPSTPTAAAVTAAVTTTEAEAMLIEALERELARAEPDVLTDADGLDAMVESATGLAIGALAVEAPVVEGSPLEPGDTGLQSPAEAGVNVNDLPTGLSPDGVTATRYSPQAETPEAAASTTALEFRPYSTLEVRRHVPLVYPRRAVDGADGTLEVAFTVSESGQVVDVTVRSEAPAVFLRAAVETIQQWEFEPVRRDGEAVPVRTALRITYEG